MKHLSPEMQAAVDLGYLAEPEARNDPQINPPELGDFLDEKFPKDTPILGPINANQIVNLIGPTGLGKTQFAQAIAHACCTGQDFLGWKSYAKVPVLYVDGEMGGAQSQTRLRQYGWPANREPLTIVNAINWCAAQGFAHPNLAEPHWQERICEWAPAGGVVALDNLMSLVHVPGVSLSSDEFWRVVTPLNLSLRAMGCTVIWVDHTNSEGRIFGTKTKEWQSDLVFTLMNNEITPDFDEKPGTAFTVAFTKVRNERGNDHRDLDVIMQPDGEGGVIWTYVTRKQAEQEIAAELYAQGLKQRAIAKEMNISLGKVNKLLNQGGKP